MFPTQGSQLSCWTSLLPMQFQTCKFVSSFKLYCPDRTAPLIFYQSYRQPLRSYFNPTTSPMLPTLRFTRKCSPFQVTQGTLLKIVSSVLDNNQISNSNKPQKFYEVLYLKLGTHLSARTCVRIKFLLHKSFMFVRVNSAPVVSNIRRAMKENVEK